MAESWHWVSFEDPSDPAHSVTVDLPPAGPNSTQQSPASKYYSTLIFGDKTAGFCSPGPPPTKEEARGKNGQADVFHQTMRLWVSTDAAGSEHRTLVARPPSPGKDAVRWDSSSTLFPPEPFLGLQMRLSRGLAVVNGEGSDRRQDSQRQPRNVGRGEGGEGEEEIHQTPVCLIKSTFNL